MEHISQRPYYWFTIQPRPGLARVMAAADSVPSPSAALFAEVLSREADWFTLGTFLGVPRHDLDNIARNCRDETVLRRLIEIHKCLQKSSPSSLCSTWEHIASCLRRMDNNKLADEIHSHYIKTDQQTTVDQPTTPPQPQHRFPQPSKLTINYCLPLHVYLRYHY